MMNKLTLVLILLCTYNFAHSQNGTISNWEGNSTKRTVFIENTGQYDQFSNDIIGSVEYAVDFGELRIFFGDKGVSHYYLKATKRSKAERLAIMNTSPDSLSHPDKEKLIGKFSFEMDEIRMMWQGCNENSFIHPENETSDYFSFGVKNPSDETVTNYNNVRGFTKITYKNLYPNIDIVYEVHETSGIKYSIILKPGANPDDIKFQYDRESLLLNGNIAIPAYFGEITEHALLTFYEGNTSNIITSEFFSNNNTYQFTLGQYDPTQTVIIDPWVQNSTFNTSSAVWEVETDLAGNVYVIGGETPFQLRKFNSAGTLQWTYTSPWDTSNVWIGTLATDGSGNSFITAGTSPEIERIDNAGNMQQLQRHRPLRLIQF